MQCGPVEEYVQLLLEAGQKFLLFAHHTTLLDAVEHSCNKKKAKWVWVGSMLVELQWLFAAGSSTGTLPLESSIA